MGEDVVRPERADEPSWTRAYAELLREWVATGERAWLPLWGGSMAPFLPGGSRILVVPAPLDRIVPGDLVVYETESRVVCHRALRRRVDGDGLAFLTKGHGWRTLEAWVAGARLIGKVAAIERDGGVTSLETPLRRLRARLAAGRSLLALRSLVALRRSKRLLRGRRRCLPAS